MVYFKEIKIFKNMKTQLQAYLVLEARLNGYNFIAEIEFSNWDEIQDEVINTPGYCKFNEFLEKNYLDFRSVLPELAQVLKIPYKKLIQLSKAAECGKGFITGDAQNNLKDYLKVRLNPTMISFLSAQSGEAGILNDEESAEEGD